MDSSITEIGAPGRQRCAENATDPSVPSVVWIFPGSRGIAACLGVVAKNTSVSRSSASTCCQVVLSTTHAEQCLKIVETS